jgi:hypothetical protein
MQILLIVLIAVFPWDIKSALDAQRSLAILVNLRPLKYSSLRRSSSLKCTVPLVLCNIHCKFSLRRISSLESQRDSKWWRRKSWFNMRLRPRPTSAEWLLTICKFHCKGIGASLDKVPCLTWRVTKNLSRLLQISRPGLNLMCDMLMVPELTYSRRERLDYQYWVICIKDFQRTAIYLFEICVVVGEWGRG